MPAPNNPPVVQKAIQAGNIHYGNTLLVVLACLVGLTLFYNIAMNIRRYIRTLASLNNDTQRYFRNGTPWFAFLKKHLLYAPLFRRQHSREMRLFGVDVGILPNRLQYLVLMGILAMNLAFLCVGIEWRGAPRDNPLPHQTLLQHLRNRAGTMAVFNMIPLVIMAGRNNPLITWLGISFDQFNLLHRWFGRTVVALAVTHGIVEVLNMNGSAKAAHTTCLAIFTEALKERFILWGFIVRSLPFSCSPLLKKHWPFAIPASSPRLISSSRLAKSPLTFLTTQPIISMLTILLTSLPAFRHAFYETFLHTHIALVSLILGGLYIHLATLPTQNLIKVIIALWAFERLQRLCSLLYRNLHLRSGLRPSRTTTATITALPSSSAILVTLRPTRPWTVQPGQHIFLTIPALGLWTSHPFAVAWSSPSPSCADPAPSLLPTPDSDYNDPEKALPQSISQEDATISLLIRPRSGFTANLANHATSPISNPINTNPSNPTTPTATSKPLTALIEGPYPTPPLTSLTRLSSYGTLLLIAAGVGITPMLPLLRSLLLLHSTPANYTSATRSIHLVWVIPRAADLGWVGGWMQELLALPGRREVLRITVFVTRPGDRKEVRSLSERVRLLPGRPEWGVVVGDVVGRGPEKGGGGFRGEDGVGMGSGVGAVGVLCCGPGGLVDEVRGVVREGLWRGGDDGGVGREVDFLEMGFGW